MSPRSSVKIVLVLALIASIAAGCSREPKTYKIGAIFDISGKASALGTPEKRTAEMVIEDINSKGGIKGHKLELVFYDTAMDKQKAINAVNRLTKIDKVLAIVGPSTSGISMAIIPTVEAAEVPLVSCAARVDIVIPVKKWVFKVPHTDEMVVAKIIEYLKEKGIKKIAILSVEGAFGAGGANQIRKQAPATGIEIVADERFSADEPNYYTQITKIKASKAQALIVWCTDKGSAKAAKNAKEKGLKIPIIMSHGVATPKFIEEAGAAANGVVFPVNKLLVAGELPDDDPQKAILLEYSRRYREKFGEAASTFGGHAWDAVHIVAKAIEKAGPDRARIRDEIENLKNFVGIGGVFNFSPDDHNGLGKGVESLVLVKIVDGKWTLLKQI